MEWIISANSNVYDHASAFDKWGFIDWKQRVSYHTGDIVYIYCTRPYKKIMYKTQVIKESMSSDKIVDDSEFWTDKNDYYKALDGKYARLQLLFKCNEENLNLDHLCSHGLKAAPQGPIRIKNNDLKVYIEKFMNDFCCTEVFPEADLPSDYYEGSVISTKVNKYERSQTARNMCIKYNGCKCAVCGFDFEKVYGPIGRGFIHIHH